MKEQEVSKVRQDLLVWAGYHNGTGISEEAMPRFHEIVEQLSALIPEMIIVQGGTCWACSKWGDNLHWWHLGLYGNDGKLHRNKRMSYLVHKECFHKAMQIADLEVQ